MEPSIKNQLDDQDAKLEEILVFAKKSERHAKISLWITIATIAVPLLILLIVVPIVLRSYLSTIESLL